MPTCSNLILNGQAQEQTSHYACVMFEFGFLNVFNNFIISFRLSWSLKKTITKMKKDPTPSLTTINALRMY